ncbi:hypothetical protein M5689_001253 [Euphorbia peplus]|nr:hypothetical protein M5689_001253 [Euphorbia peplus]
MGESSDGDGDGDGDGYPKPTIQIRFIGSTTYQKLSFSLCSPSLSPRLFLLLLFFLLLSFPVHGIESESEAVPHIPSFIALKDVLSGHDAEVLNVNSRCAELSLHNEAETVSLVAEKDIKFTTNHGNELDSS